MDDLIPEIVSAALLGFVVTFLLGYVYRRAERANEHRSLYYGPEIKGGGWIGMAIAVACAVSAFVVTPGMDQLAFALAALMFGGMSVPLLGEAHSTRGYFDDEQIELSSWWREPKRARRTDLKSARFRKYGQSYELVFADGTKIAFSKVLRGHRSVCDHVQSLGHRIDGIEDDRLTR